MKFMAMIKGDGSGSSLQEILKLVGILQYSNTYAGNLSGGTKRKLCLAMALLKDPLMVFLDEPSSGLDPVSRRSFWDTVQKVKNCGHAVILTTHHLEEAEALADKLTIISRGRLLIYGSCNYVKKVFSEGYTLSLTFEDHLLAERIREKVKEEIRNVKINPQTSRNKLQCILPFESTHQFSSLFKSLELFSKVDISISQNTLEETFVMISEKEEEVLLNHGIDIKGDFSKAQKIKLDIEDNNEIFMLRQNVTTIGLIRSIFFKKILVSIRDPAFVFLFFIPIFFLSLVSWIIVFELFPLAFDIKDLTFADFLVTIYYITLGVYSFICSGYVFTPVSERETGMRHLLRMMGCSSGSYFIGSFIADLFFHFIAILLVFIISSVLWIFSSVYAFEPSFLPIIKFFTINMIMAGSFISISYFTGFIFSQAIMSLQFFNILFLFYNSAALAVVSFSYYFFPNSIRRSNVFSWAEAIFAPLYNWIESSFPSFSRLTYTGFEWDSGELHHGLR